MKRFLVMPQLIRKPANLGIVATTGLPCLVLQDGIAVGCDLSADRRACRLGPEMAAAGRGYYDKMLRRHVALRTLTPEDQGKKRYTLRGDHFPKLIRTYPTSIEERRDLCQSMMTINSSVSP